MLLDDYDIENEPLVAILVDPPTRGLLTFRADGSFVYEPELGFIGTDSFRYMASDGTDTGSPTTVTVHVEVNVSTTPPAIPR